MAAQPLGDAEVDVCASCGGMWVDWFDGDVRQVATAIIEGESSGQRDARPLREASSLRSEHVATGACPRCMRQLAVERYVIRAALGADRDVRRVHMPASTTTGADLLRCEECAGVFVPRTSAALLATLPPDEEAPPSAALGGAVLEPLPWQRFVALVKRLVGLRG
jgi:hypothetical protein